MRILVACFVLAGCGGIGIGEGACGPYAGSYSGILTYQWRDGTKNPAQTGTGTITVAFHASCPPTTVAGAAIVDLNIDSAMSDFATYGAPTMTAVNGGMQMPPNPPASGNSPQFGITINWPNAHVLNINGPLTVTSAAAIISNDIPNTTGWSEGGLPSVPAGAQVTSNTYKIDHD